MKRKEFIEKINKVISKCEKGVNLFSCTQIDWEWEGFKTKPRIKYEEFIYVHLWDSYTLNEEFESWRTLLRLLLLESFKLECLASKEYLKF